ncbi:MAG: hypothetical protein GFH27_549281n434 [Chloroflexi bacterium AL-W]|nr:hypothetical protein [Chloroflexi bacterium AL-N1]NOK70927.1 hypothetical protein [Chloroflexi bacterium AL-N10]NOK73200.1 hypothetical protein [Chloroflexi bacterium AL-N5]NOK80097.1 hypothetical protein [Chloroflexi bacterium AL-W]NOK88048.1 hypothetical protein [Chloroflexi bacterium AL-N15]
MASGLRAVMHPVIAWFPRRMFFKWRTASIRTKILVPLTLLMLLSVLGSTIGFIISTNTTRNSILDGEIAGDGSRLIDVLSRREEELTESASILANDSVLIGALELDQVGPDGSQVLIIDDRALQVRTRFRLDQVLVLNADNQVRVNIVAQSYLSYLTDVERDQLLGSTTATETMLVQSDQATLLVGRAPVRSSRESDRPDEVIGMVYTFLNVSEELSRLRRDLGLQSEVQIADSQPIAATLPLLEQQTLGREERVELATASYRTRMYDVTLGSQPVQIALLRSEEESNAIVGAGFQVMLLSSGMTFLLLLGLGIFLARSFTRPILQLADVAESVAAGDRSRRANLTDEDEIGQLGRSFDEATETIIHLLDEQAHISGELQAILQSIADGVIAIDNQERIVLINSMAVELLGQRSGTLVSQPLDTLLDVEDTTFCADMQRIVEQLKHTHKEREITDEKHALLGTRMVSLRSAPIVTLSGTRIGSVMVLHDITRVVEADRAKSDFIATASHELRTPLAAAIGYLDLFHLDGIQHLTTNQRSAFDAIKRQTDTLVLLTNDLLEMARIERGAVRVEQRWVEAASTIDEALVSLQSLFQSREMHLVCNIDADLPPLWIDVLHLRRVLTNLLSNALKYTPSDGLIVVRAYEIEDYATLPSAIPQDPWPHANPHSIVIEIEDNGVGIHPEDQDKIFTRFYRARNSLSVEAGGTGLGLTITHALVLLHGGQIGFRSAEGQGSCFWVRFPIHAVDSLQNREVNAAEALYFPKSKGT